MPEILENGVPVAVSISIENKEALKIAGIIVVLAVACSVIVFGIKKAFFK